MKINYKLSPRTKKDNKIIFLVITISMLLLTLIIQVLTIHAEAQQTMTNVNITDQYVEPIAVQEPPIEVETKPEIDTCPLTTQSITPKTSELDATTKCNYMSQAGISIDDYIYVDYIITMESMWDYQAINYSSGAQGLCQMLPSLYGEQPSDPIGQLINCNDYAIERYGSWENAYQFWINNNWW